MPKTTLELAMEARDRLEKIVFDPSFTGSINGCGTRKLSNMGYTLTNKPDRIVVYLSTKRELGNLSKKIPRSFSDLKGVEIVIWFQPHLARVSWRGRLN